jgi:hypothetical protein
VNYVPPYVKLTRDQRTRSAPYLGGTMPVTRIRWVTSDEEVRNAAQPTGPLTLRQQSKHGASDQEQNEFARSQPSVIVLTVPTPPKNG